MMLAPVNNISSVTNEKYYINYPKRLKLFEATTPTILSSDNKDDSLFFDKNFVSNINW